MLVFAVPNVVDRGGVLLLAAAAFSSLSAALLPAMFKHVGVIWGVCSYALVGLCPPGAPPSVLCWSMGAKFGQRCVPLKLAC